MEVEGFATGFTVGVIESSRVSRPSVANLGNWGNSNRILAMGAPLPLAPALSSHYACVLPHSHSPDTMEPSPDDGPRAVSINF